LAPFLKRNRSKKAGFFVIKNCKNIEYYLTRLYVIFLT
jgi:hypothetical protein